MCQLPLISMWVVRMRSPEKWMSSHLPRDSTFSTVRPATGLWSFTPANGAYAVSKRLIVSPSGIGSSDRQQCAPEIEAKRRHVETGFLEELRKEMLPGRLAVDGGDQ